MRRIHIGFLPIFTTLHPEVADLDAQHCDYDAVRLDELLLLQFAITPDFLLGPSGCKCTYFSTIGLEYQPHCTSLQIDLIYETQLYTLLSSHANILQVQLFWCTISQLVRRHRLIFVFCLFFFFFFKKKKKSRLKTLALTSNTHVADPLSLTASSDDDA